MRRWQLLIALTGVVIVIAVAGFRGSRGPSYQGRSLNNWLKDYGPNPIGGGLMHDKFSKRRSGPQSNSATEAIRAMGTNAIAPLLAEIKRDDDPPWLATARRLLQKQNWLKWRLPDARSRREQAALALFDLGTNGLAAMPDLARLLTNYSSAVYAIHALAGLGTNAIPVFASVLTNGNTWISDCGVWGLAQLGPESRGVVPQILPLLEKGNTADMMLILWALGEIHEPVEVIRPELSSRLGDSDPGVRSAAARGLSKLGVDAKPASPQIEAALQTESEPHIRQVLQDLLKRLDQDGNQLGVPALLDFPSR